MQITVTFDSLDEFKEYMGIESPSQIAQEAYSFAFEKNKIGIGSALSVVYILNVLLVLGLVLLLTRKAVSKYGK